MSEPIVYLLAFGYGLTPLVGDLTYLGEKVDYVRFLAPGMVAVGILFQAFFEGAYGTFVRLTFQRTWHAQLTTPLTFADVFFGDLTWAATKGFIAGTLTGIIAILWGAMSFYNLLCILPIIAIGSFVFASFGLLSAGIATRVDHINVPIFLFVVPMFAICGTYFPRDTLPDWLGNPVAFLPLSALVDLTRSFIHFPRNLGLSLLSLIVWGIAFGAIAWNRLEKKIYR
jgi:lipooligosaccharide transport system permease protein